jgi:hypothetical protein
VLGEDGGELRGRAALFEEAAPRGG